jgi:hypothetical protein
MAASPKQTEYINKLLATKIVPAPLRDHAGRVLANSASSWRIVSDLIDDLKLCDWKPREDAQPLPALEPGTYEHDGVIFRVQLNRETKRPYAKVWDGRSWFYDTQAYRQHAAGAVVIPLERVIEIGLATGHCVKCATNLRDPLSIEAGIGPVCVVKHYGTTREAIIEARKRELALQPA